MPYRRSMISMMLTMLAVGLAATAVGCDPASDSEGALTAAHGEEGGSAYTTSAGGAHDVDGGEGGAGRPASTSTSGTTTASTSGTDGESGSTGGVEDTHFGMSDDMPLVADIPDIKRGLWGDDNLVTIEQVRLISGRAELDRDAWFYVQDPVASKYMGLRVTLASGDVMPTGPVFVDLEGYVRYDEQGWQLELQSAVEGGPHAGIRVQRVRIAALTADDAEIFDDSVVDVVEPVPLVVTRLGPEPGTLLVGETPTSSGALLVDLRPFGLEQALPPPGTALSRLRGVVEMEGSRPVILPRNAADLVVQG
jgi:hypothetical protein